jgi:ferredoxin
VSPTPTFRPRPGIFGRFFWAPAIGWRGISRVSLFKDILIGSGAGVGGGSLVYANTLYRANPAFFAHQQWAGLADWQALLAPHYDTAERMLGVQTVPWESENQKLLRAMGEHFGAAHTFRRTPCAVYFGAAGVTVPDPYFGGAGPDRTGCTRCGGCTTGCSVGAKNTLVKNYLWFAEKLGVDILPDTEVATSGRWTRNGTAGYAVATRRPGAWFGGDGRRLRARGVVVAAGALGTNRLLANCKHGGGLPRLSDRLGQLVRTNSESILAVTLPDDAREVTRDVSISASIHVSHDTHIELVSYGDNASYMKFFFTLLTGKGTRLTRPLLLLAQVLRHPLALPEVAVAHRLEPAQRDPAGDAAAGQRDCLRREPAPLRPGRAPEHRAARREAQPDLHRRGQRGGGLAGGTYRRDCAEHGARSAGQYPDHGPHPRRRGDRRRCRERRGGPRRPRLRLCQSAGLRRRHHAGQSRGQSQPDHHRAGRTCHEPRAASEMLLSRLPRTISCKSAKMRTPTVRHEA